MMDNMKKSFAMKAVVFAITVAVIALSVISLPVSIFAFEHGIYHVEDAEEFADCCIRDIAYGDAVEIGWCLSNRDEDVIHMLADGEISSEADEAAASYCREREISEFTFKDDKSGKVIWNFKSDQVSDEEKIQLYADGAILGFGENSGKYGTIKVEMKTAADKSPTGMYYLIDKVAEPIYKMRYAILFIWIAAAAIILCGSVYLISASGHRKGDMDMVPGKLTKIPFDIVTAAAAAACIASWGVFIFGINTGMVSGGIRSLNYEVMAVIGIIAGIASASVILGWCMCFAFRIKLGGWWKNTLIYRCMAFAGGILKKALVIFKKPAGKVREIAVNLPVLWKTCIAIAAVTLVEIMFSLFVWSSEMLVFCIVEKLILAPMVLAVALNMKKLQKAGAAIAEGNLGYKVDTDHLILDFKKHGEDLNRIGEGINAAVEQRMRSERMKTELITNVSHDIKTPLTSIINYSDLIGKEECDNEKIREYSDVLHRQSEKLKRLIEDLVEASKASTGNIEIKSEACDAGVLLMQAVGEYEEKISAAGLELIAEKPENPVYIMADGRRLWRVFDNLLNNICKYSMRNTRVYVMLERASGKAVISFRNISSEPLNLSADELIERFVRGDSSRNTEGSGLGLSIAKNLTELQGGIMEITSDGDLFKVILRFEELNN